MSLTGYCHGGEGQWLENVEIMSASNGEPSRYINISDPPLTLSLILGYICYPVAFLMGVPRNKDLYKVGQLIGVKLIEVRLRWSIKSSWRANAVT